MIRAAALCSLVVLTASCLSSAGLTPLATSHAASDLSTYGLRRVALLPFEGEELDEVQARSIQGAFHLELGRAAPYELVRLTPADVAEVEDSEPYRRGAYDPRTLLELARRFRLDGVMIATVTQLDVYPPQLLSLELDLVSCETGAVIWTSSLQMDASDALVRRHMADFQRTQANAGDWEDGVRLTLISPTHFARFAASEVAKRL